jgi:hypothetical protein
MLSRLESYKSAWSPGFSRNDAVQQEATETIECCTWDKTSVIAGPVGSLKAERFRPRSNTLRHPSHLCFLSFPPVSNCIVTAEGGTPNASTPDPTRLTCAGAAEGTNIT